MKYILHQRSEGHGVITKYVPEDCDLLIIVDSSTNSTDECKELSERCDIITLDHHEQYQDNPHCTLVNCTLHNYPNHHLCGATLAWKFCLAYDITTNNDLAYDCIDLAMAGLVFISPYQQ